MAIEFNLEVAHSDYHDLIIAVMENLSKRFPVAALKKVTVYPAEAAKNCPDCINRSLGDATEPGVIRLNGYWLEKPPGFLQEAGEADDYMPGPNKLRWHGGMPQPGQVLVHEFFHILRDGLEAEAEEFSHRMWLQATEKPANAFSAYSLFNASEWWAECGAGLILGENKNLQVLELGHFLEESLAQDDFVLFDPNKHPRSPDGSFRKGR
jgi:hypothetical protein